MTSPATRRAAKWIGPVVSLTTTLLIFVVAEVGLRIADDQPLTRLALEKPDALGAKRARDMTSFAKAAWSDRGTKPEWINQAPPPLSDQNEPDPELLAWRDAARATGWVGFELNLYRQWNSVWRAARGCEPGSPLEGHPVPIYSFDSPDGTMLPVFRYLPNRKYPDGMETNSYAWRGPEIPLDKEPGVIRLAFVGASTTVGNPSCPFSYPEYIVHWLNLWAQSEYPELRFEVLNAAREGLSALNIFAVVRSEVLPMEPDLIFYYEGVNQLRRWLDSFDVVSSASKPVAISDRFGMNSLTRLSRHSMIFARLRHALMGLWRSGTEPEKPDIEWPWTATLDAKTIDTFDEDLPFGLSPILANLNAIQNQATSIGSELALASFVFLANEGMTIDPWRRGEIEDFYTNTLWPLSYKEIRRLADFQNRVLREYSRRRIIPYVGLAEAYPQDPSLFHDGVHFNCDGIRLQAWIVFQKLMPLVRGRIESGRWPRADQEKLLEHPGISTPREVEHRCDDVAG